MPKDAGSIVAYCTPIVFGQTNKTNGVRGAKDAKSNAVDFRSKQIRRWTIWSGFILAILVVGRAILPVAVESYVNRTLRNLDSYNGTIGDVDIALWRGAYRIENVVIDKVRGGSNVPFLTSEGVDISIEWRALFHGSLAGEVELQSPHLSIFDSPKDADDELGTKGNWTETLQELVPFQINRFAVKDGKLTFRGGAEKELPPIEIHQITGQATNISNAVEQDEALPSNIELSGFIQNQSFCVLKGGFNLISKPMDMDIAMSSDPIELTSLNPVLRRYAKLDAEGGTLGIYSELAIKDGIIDGYFKILAQDLKLFTLKEDSGNPLELIWEGLAGIVSTLTRNQPRDQFAAKVPLSGDISNLNTGIFPAIGSVFKNAFVKAFSRDFDETVSLNTAEK